MRSKGRAVVSACLAGVKCRYDGGSCEVPEIVQLLREGMAVPVCPEQLGGLPTPRPRSEISSGSGEDVLDGRSKVVSEDGRDLTAEFIRGAHEALRIARLFGAERAIFKRRSPSCGCGEIYLEGSLKPGNGVTAALFMREGIEVVPA